MPERTILLVEDDATIREGLLDALESEGYRVLEAPDGVEGLRLGLEADPDLILLDLMLPGLDGLEVLKRLRADAVATPVLVLTAKGLEVDKVAGFRAGADDYIVKPFGLAELLARVDSRMHAWDRERGLDAGRALRFGRVVVDFARRRAHREGETLHLTPQEFELLAFLAAHEGRPLSRAALLDGVWRTDVSSRVVDTAILGLRRKVGARFIESVRGVGYRFTRKA